VHKERDDMPQILKQRITVDSHKGDHCQRKQGHRHDNDPDRGGHRDPHQFRIAYQNHKENSFDGIAGLHHAAEKLTGIRVIGRNGVNVTVFLFFHGYTLEQILRNDGNIQNVICGDVGDLLVLRTDDEQIIGQGVFEPFNQFGAVVFLFCIFCYSQGLAVDKSDPIIGYKHNFTFPFENYLVMSSPVAINRMLDLGI